MTGHRPSPTTSKYHRHGSSFHGSPVDARMRSDDRSCARTGASPCAISARISVGDTPSTLTRWRSTQVPQPVRARVVGRAVVEHERAAVGERADDLPRSHDPADVGEPEQPLARAQVGLERDLFGDLHEEAAVHVHRALGPAGRAARVRDEQRVLAVDRRPRRTRSRSAACVRSCERDVALRLSSARRAPSRGTTTTVCTVGTCATASSAISFIATVLPRRVNPSAVIERDRARVVEAHRDRVGAVAGEDRQEDRAELGDGEQRGDRLRDHRQEQPDRVALPTPRAAQPRRDARRSSARSSDQVSVAGRRPPRPPRRPRHVDGRGSSAHLSTHVDGDVQRAAGEPLRPRDAVARVEHPLVGRREPDAEEAHHRVPEPLGVVDRTRDAARRSRRCRSAGHEPRDVALGEQLGVGAPDEPGERSPAGIYP